MGRDVRGIPALSDDVVAFELPATQQSVRSEERVDGETRPMPLNNDIPVDPRTGRVHLRTLLCRLAMHAAGRTTPRPSPTPLRPRLPLRRAYREVPEEIWLMVFGYLSKDDLLNLARVAKFIGAVAESRLYREAQLSRLNFVFWSVAVSVPHRASAVRVLTLSLAGKEGIFPTSGVVSRLGATLRSLPDLRELSVYGVKLLTSEYRNILSGVSFTRLRKFACDSDELVLASWASLAEQKELEDFRGLYRHDTHLPSNIRPGVWPKLRILEAGAVFLERIDKGSQITHLSTYLPRMTASQILQRVTETLGGHLIGLRVIRTILAPRSGGIHWFVEPQLNTDLYWESDSPVALCGALRAPALKFLELRDISPAKRSWATNTESLREQRRFGRAFRSSQRQERSPSLEMLLWRPVWGDAAQPLPGIVRDNILDMLHILPVRYVGMPMITTYSWTARGDKWSLWERKDPSHNREPGLEDFLSNDVLQQTDGAMPFESLWATYADGPSIPAPRRC